MPVYGWVDGWMSGRTNGWMAVWDTKMPSCPGPHPRASFTLSSPQKDAPARPSDPTEDPICGSAFSLGGTGNLLEGTGNLRGRPGGSPG